MPIVAKDAHREYPTAPEGLHQAVCVDVVDLGMVKNQWGEKHSVEIRWILADLVAETTGEPYMVRRRYNLSLNEKASLRAHLEAWRGRKFTPEELQGFDLEKLIGVNCQLQVVHDLADDGRTWANVSSVVPLGKGMVKMRVPESYIRVVDRDKQNPRAGLGKTHDETGEEIPF